ncbi:MAG TPA: cation:proton antiporter, partial [Solimonas sp.]|nr:cation:proton antiporter [Solimonas sp.]
MLHLLIALAAVILLGLVLARLLARLHQPPVIGEVLAGILLGPSLLGTGLSQRILPPDVAPNLQLIAQLGVVLYMFCVGLELNAGTLRRRMGPTLAISLSGMVLPFALGVLLALWLYPPYAGVGAQPLPFALFLGVALSVTAFPVLARILSDRGMTRTDLGQLALSAAATGDLLAWCLLAGIVGVTTAQVGSGLRVLAGTAAYLALMLVVVRPLLT